MNDLAKGKWPARLNGALGAVLGVLLAAMGVFLIAFEEPGSDEYVQVGGSEIDADAAGGTLLAAGILTLAISLWSLRRHKNA